MRETEGPSVTNAESNEERTVLDVFLRADGTAVWNRQQAVVDRVEELVESGVIDRYRVRVWSAAASLSGPLSRTVFHRSARSKATEFEHWAVDQEKPVDLPFERETAECTFTDEQFDLIRLPVVCVALYTDDEVQGVAPCTVDGEPVSVKDFLDTLEADGRPAFAPVSTPE